MDEVREISLEEAEKIYGPVPESLTTAPTTHELNEALEGTLKEDEEVVIDETSN